MNDFPLKIFTEKEEKKVLAIEGEIQYVKVRENGYAIKIENSWYNKFGGTPTVKVGDRIVIEYTINEKGFKNIEGITMMDKATIGTTILCPYCSKKIEISVK